MIVDHDGRFVSQRTQRRLTHIRSDWLHNGIWLRTEGMAPLFVPTPDGDASHHPVRIWNDTVQATPADEATAAWCHTALGEACNLVYMTAESARLVSPEYGEPDDEVSFADGYPILITTTASLAELNKRLQTPVPMARFRPNLVIEAEEPFAEDEWERLRVGPVVLRVVKPCARCVVTTLDPATGEAGKEPLRTLARFREQDGKVYFGMNAIPERLGQVTVGDEVEVLGRGGGKEREQSVIAQK